MRLTRTAANVDADRKNLAIVEQIVSDTISALQRGEYADYWCADGHRYLILRLPAEIAQGVKSILFTTAPLQKGTASGLYQQQHKMVQVNIPTRFFNQVDIEPCVPSATNQNQDAVAFAAVVAKQLVKSDRRRGTLTHELVHHFDFLRVGPRYRYKGRDLTDSEERAQYFNEDLEYNAHFQTGAAAFWKDFNEVLAEDSAYQARAFVETFGPDVSSFVRDTVYGYWKEEFFRSLSRELYHHFLKRLAQLYNSARAKLATVKTSRYRTASPHLTGYHYRPL